MNDALMAQVSCPYFTTLTKLSISCEGAECAKVMHWFSSREEEEAFVEKYCSKSNSDCPLRKTLEKKYESTM